MNFEAVRQGNGQLVSMPATVDEVGASKLNKNNKPFVSLQLRDDAGEKYYVTVNKGTGQLVDAQQLGNRLQFNLSTYQGQRGVAYSGFWNNQAQVAPRTAQQAVQQAQQDTQQAAQAQKPAPGPVNSVNSSIERQCAFKSACTWGIGKTADEVMKLTKRGIAFIQTGQVGGFDQFAAANPVEQDNIPFE